MKDSAVKPNFFSNFPSLKKDEEAKGKGATDEERMYYGMSQTAGWKLFTEDIERLLTDLDALNDNGVAQGMSYEELGKNTIVVSLTKGIIRKLLAKVSDSQEACESGGK